MRRLLGPGSGRRSRVCPQDGADIGTQCLHIVEPPGGSLDERDPAAFGGDPHVQLLLGGEQIDLAARCDDDRVGQIDGRWEGQPRKRLVDH